MRKQLWLAVAMLLVGVGCSSEFGIGGRLDKAMEQDTEEAVEEVKGDCPAGQHRKKPKLPCKDQSCQPGCVAD